MLVIRKSPSVAHIIGRAGGSSLQVVPGVLMTIVHSIMRVRKACFRVTVTRGVMCRIIERRGAMAMTPVYWAVGLIFVIG